MKVRINKKKLLEKLEENKAKHRKIFEEAIEGYRIKVVEVFEKRLNDIKEGKKIVTYINLVEPFDHTKDYDLAIAMMKMSVDEKIELDQKQFNNFIQDEWGWKKEFLMSNAGYSQTASDELDE